MCDGDFCFWESQSSSEFTFDEFKVRQRSASLPSLFVWRCPGSYDKGCVKQAEWHFWNMWLCRLLDMKLLVHPARKNTILFPVFEMSSKLFNTKSLVNIKHNHAEMFAEAWLGGIPNLFSWILKMLFPSLSFIFTLGCLGGITRIVEMFVGGVKRLTSNLPYTPEK